MGEPVAVAPPGAQLPPRTSSVQAWLTVLALAIGAIVGLVLHDRPDALDVRTTPSWLTIAWATEVGIALFVLPLVWAAFSRATKPMRTVMYTVALAGLARVLVGFEPEADCASLLWLDVVAAGLVVVEFAVMARRLDLRGRDRRATTYLALVVALLLGDYLVATRSCSLAHPDGSLWALAIGGGVLIALAIAHGRFDIGRVPKLGRLGARAVSIDAFRSVTDRAFELFTEYYENADRARFEADLDDMQVAVVLEDDLTGELRGFSLLHLQARRDVSGRPCTIIFAGDTVIERRSLGQGALQREWARLLGRTKLRRPWRPLHWFLTCRDYRTYLLLVENVRTAVPKYTIVRPSPVLSTMLGFVAGDRYGDRWDPEAGVVRADPDSPRPRRRTEVPVITDELAQANPHVAFYLDHNPGYLEGDRLVCIGDLTGRRVLQLWLVMTFRAPARARRALAARAAD
jgi:hypothetical protein